MTEERTDGFIKVVTTGRGQILGASIAGCHAGELVLPWVMAIEHDIKILAMAKLIAPYPTYSEISKRVAGSYFTPLLFSERARNSSASCRGSAEPPGPGRPAPRHWHRRRILI